MKNFLKFIAFIWIVKIVISLLSNAYNALESNTSNACPEETKEYQVENEWIIHHRRNWEDRYNSQNYCTAISVNRSDFELAQAFKSTVGFTQGILYHELWGDIYRQLYQQDHLQIEPLLDSLLDLKTQYQLDYNEFAYLIVNFVQDIPYSYIETAACDDTHSPCLGNQKFGITSPLEFLYSLHGDCDSRTVLLFTIFKDLGYEPLVLISREYLHSMLALNMPSSGDHLVHRGKKYYFWETTNKGWSAGIIPPDLKNKSYWKIALDHEL